MSTSTAKTPAEPAQDHLGRVGHALPEALLVVSSAGVVEAANAAAAALLGHARGDIEGRQATDLVVPRDCDRLADFLRSCARSGSLVPGSADFAHRDGGEIACRVEGATLGPPDRAVVLRLRSRESTSNRFRVLTEKIDELGAEIRRRRRAETLLEGELEAIQMVVSAATLREVLECLVAMAERNGSPGLLASVLLLDEAGTRLRCAAAPSLPPAYNDAIDGIEIGPEVGSCGSAAFHNREVVARDIGTHPNWKHFKSLALGHDLRACWSTPIPASDGSVLGTFALYYREPTDPPALDGRVVAAATRIASIAIERHRETERVERLLDAERVARADAESANRAKDEFLALVSHELRNPLNAMLGWTRLLRMRELDDETREQGIETIERNAELQGQLIGDVLDYARVSSDQLKLELAPGAVGEIVETAVDSLLPDAEAVGLKLDLRIDPIPPTLCDRSRLHQVVINLAGNAIKFTPSGGRVVVRADTSDEQIRISVQDSGQGISPDFLPHVFEPFRQGDGSMSRSHAGLGLGLSVVERIVGLHGGTVRAESDGPGTGATFVVELPLRPAERESHRPDGTGGAPSVAGLEVLVVDDESDARELVATILRQFGARPTVAGSAAQAIAALDARNGLRCEAASDAEPPDARAFDVLVSDIAMPELDGYALIRAVREREDRYASIPAAALTAHVRDGDRATAHAAGYDCHLVKPVDPARLLEAIASLSRG